MHALRQIAVGALALTVGLAAPSVAQEKTEFRVAWSIYVGWMPWGYLEDSGIMDKWAEKYGIDVEIVQINDYIESSLKQSQFPKLNRYFLLDLEDKNAVVIVNYGKSMLVEDKAGVLARVSSLLARRGFNIHSLAVGPTSEPHLSRMTIVVEAASAVTLGR